MSQFSRRYSMSSSSWTSPNAVPVNEVVSESTNDAGSGRPPSGDVTGANALETGSKMSPKNVVCLVSTCGKIGERKNAATFFYFCRTLLHQKTLRKTARILL